MSRLPDALPASNLGALGARQTHGEPGRQWLILACGWIIPQMFLLGPALIGRTVYAPVDLLALPGMYLPKTPEYQGVVPQDLGILDLVQVSPAARKFCVQEFHAGRLPLWQTGNYTGSPFATWPKYSPFELPFYLFPSPVTLAWMQLIQVLCCGVGMWLFLREAVRLMFWPAALISWCAPLTGFLSLWQGFPVAASVAWFPWILLGCERVIRKPWGASGIALALLTGLLLLTGQTDVAGLVLLTAGLYSLWQLLHAFTGNLPQAATVRVRRVVSTALSLGLAWLLGFMLAAPYILPLLEYARTGTRIQSRLEGREERPPIGLQALPEVVVPDTFGSSRDGSLRVVQGNQLESGAAGYAGLLATLWLAPLAWCHPRQRRITVFWSMMVCLSLSWTFNVFGIVQLLRSPPLNLLSYNRWAFAGGFGILILAGIGLEQLLSGPVALKRWAYLPAIAALAAALWCLLRAIDLPEPIRSELDGQIRRGQFPGLSLDGLLRIQNGFVNTHLMGAGVSLAALAAWGMTASRRGMASWCRNVLLLLTIGELFWFAASQVRQSAAHLYFPPIPALEQLAALRPGRVWGVNCLPPNINQMAGLEDVRGYDGVDPAYLVALLKSGSISDPRFEQPHAATQMAVPVLFEHDGKPRLHPIVGLLNVRYVVLRTRPPAQLPTIIHADDYWVIENADSLPRAFVPGSVQRVASDTESLERMAQTAFDPRLIAYMTDESPGLPAEIRGSVSVQHETPGSVSLEADMATDGMVVLTDLWDTGWQADLNGNPVPIERVDVAFRGVRVPAGKHSIRMTYAPASLHSGISACLFAVLVLFLQVVGTICLTNKIDSPQMV